MTYWENMEGNGNYILYDIIPAAETEDNNGSLNQDGLLRGIN
jgi:hypothetical protein